MNDLIDFWTNEITKNPIPEIFEAAFLRIYTEYENYLRKTFISFSLGVSYTSYVPDRKLLFIDEVQLTDLIKGESRFVDYINAIPRCSKHIFQKDPFNTVLSAWNYHDDLMKMKYIRDYLSHRSDESRGRYERAVLNTYSINSFIEPGNFLQKKRNGSSDIFYSYYCNIFVEIFEYFNNDELLKAIPS